MDTDKEMAKVDELNRLYNSRDPNDIIRFYDHFNTPEELIEWSRNRPHGRAKIYTVKGDTDIVVVIPTADRHGEYAKNCEKEIFKGQQIVFVESGGRDDPYFNYARNCNIGLRYALRYKPRWIVLSNDDMYKIDNFSTLKTKLDNFDNKSIESILINPEPEYYHSYPISLVKRTLASKFYRSLSKSRRVEEKLLDKFNARYSLIPVRKALKTIFLKVVYYPVLFNFYNVGDFAVFGSEFIKIKKGTLFDETFVSGWEDSTLSLSLTRTNSVDFKIGSRKGRVLGQNSLRNLRNIINKVYFSTVIKRSNKSNRLS